MLHKPATAPLGDTLNSVSGGYAAGNSLRILRSTASKENPNLWLLQERRPFSISFDTTLPAIRSR